MEVVIELTKENIIDHIIACANAMDKLDARRSCYIPVPDWFYDLVKTQLRQRAALARFKLNSSFWPNQFDWMP
jgi:hypothetical protein